jgi:DNA-binding transcriptional MerR regulator
MYTIKELADLAGVTTRTLRYYDQLGILPPARIGNNGYRYYDHSSMLRLQQILFYKELALPLDEIEAVLNQPGFQLIPALEKHQAAIRSRIDQYQMLLVTLQRTIRNLKGEIDMSDQEYFEGFDEKKYEQEAFQLWGGSPKFRESQRKWSSYSDEQKEEIKAEGGRITVRMVTDRQDAKPDDPDVQQAVADYHAYLNQFFYTSEVGFLRNLADMWVADPRFAVNYERIREGGAAFVREAVHIYCDRNE